MSPSDLMPFRVRTEGWDEITRLTVFDGHDRVQARGIGEVSADLPRGLYQVRMERLGAMEEHVVIHDKPTDTAFHPPARSSAMPAADTRETHEFFQGPGVHFSTHSTVAEDGHGPDDVRLMIMLRASGDGRYEGGDLAAGLSLLDARGTRITSFAPEECEADDSVGWLIYSAMLPVGSYLLVRDGGEGRARFLPLVLYPGWDSLVFVPYDRGLRLGRASLDMARRGRGFDPGDTRTQLIDGALQGLGENLDLMPADMREMAIYGKFDHPLHGLIGAHAHFLGERRAERLEAAMLSNLWHLMPGSADVIALLVRSLEREGGLPADLDALVKEGEAAFGADLSPLLPLDFPPMLRPGLRSLLRASSQIDGLVATGSWLEAAALSSFDTGGPWTVWDQEVQAEAVPETGAPSTQKLYAAMKRALATETGMREGQLKAVTRMRDMPLDRRRLPGMVEEVGRELGMRTRRAAVPAPDDRLRDLVKQMRDAAQTGIAAPPARITPQTALPRWVVDFAKLSLARSNSRESVLLGGNGDIDPEDLARRAGVPVAHMRAALDQITAHEILSGSKGQLD